MNGLIKSNALVSIIITYINETGFLKEALQSALKQSLKEVEIIVVCNDRNSNRQEDIFPGNDKIKWLHEPVPGSAFARNTGLNNASGDWIQFHDVDDLLLPGKIAHQWLKATGGAVVSPHLYRRLDGSLAPSKWISADVWEGLLNSGLGSTSSMLWNRKALLEAGGWSSAYQSHQEYELLFRLLMGGYTITFEEERETIVRGRKEGSITQQTKHVRAKEGIRLREAIWEYLLENSLDTPSRKNAFLQYTFRQLRGLYRQEPDEAKRIFNHYFSPGKFTPEKNGIPFYPLLFGLLGFGNTEKVYSLYSTVRDKYLPFLPKNN